MGKNKKQENNHPELISYIIILVGILGVIILIGLNSGWFEKNTHYDENTYEPAQQADKIAETWEEYVSIINSDRETTNSWLDTYCPTNIDYRQIPACVNNIRPKLESYATHVVDAQNFIIDNEDFFDKPKTILADLDSDIVYIKARANEIDIMVRDYNLIIQNQQEYQQQQADLYSEVTRILTLSGI